VNYKAACHGLGQRYAKLKTTAEENKAFQKEASHSWNLGKW
jgi:hypothetical protein